MAVLAIVDKERPAKHVRRGFSPAERACSAILVSLSRVSLQKSRDRKKVSRKHFALLVCTRECCVLLASQQAASQAEIQRARYASEFQRRLCLSALNSVDS